MTTPNPAPPVQPPVVPDAPAPSAPDPTPAPAPNPAPAPSPAAPNPASAPAAPAPALAPANPTPPSAPGSPPATPAPAPPAPGDVASLPDWARKLITDARGEAAKTRTTAKQAAAEQARAELTTQIGRALGLITDEDTAPDPAALTDQLVAAQNDARRRTIELAVYQAAGRLGADPDAILDSRTFADSVSDLNPSDEAFTARLTERIAAALEANSRLRVPPPAPAPSPPPVPQAAGGEFPGAPATSAAITEAALGSMTPEQITAAFQNGSLSHLL
ncbi:hypothetical protein [Actinomadura litoris]|uniref:hypothetical protein n=1 Tax=Actinomadura litoris TaxID=2678616 RepID=UPI001FA76284|nr:hypothetical protein [Actinomadura litoris]